MKSIIITTKNDETVSLPVLLPDPDQNIEARSEWADKALNAFIAEAGVDLEDSLGDLLADLMHWCDRNDFDFDAALDRGRYHYEADTSAEGL